MKKKNPHAVALGRKGGAGGTGDAKRRNAQLKAYWASEKSRHRWNAERKTFATTG